MGVLHPSLKWGDICALIFEMNAITVKLVVHHFQGVGKIDQGISSIKQTSNYMTSNDLVGQRGKTIFLLNNFYF